MARQARRKKSRAAVGGPALGWLTAGIFIGLGAAALLYHQGFIPSRPESPEPVATEAPAQPPRPLDNGTEESRYDFFTVLPEMEVVVPERELSSRAQPGDPSDPAAAGERFVLQVGSFRSAAEAEQQKAQLALLGAVADIQRVTVNGETWHRVRIGPVEGAREANRLVRQLQDNGIEVLVLK